MSATDGTLREALLAVFATNPQQQFKTNELSKLIGIKSDDDAYQVLRETLDDLAETGAIERTTRRRYQLAQPELQEVTGTLGLQASGKAIVKVDATFGARDTILIRNEHLRTALNGDRVRVTLLAAKPGERPRGEVVEVLERSEHHVVGVLHRDRFGYFVRPEHTGIKRDIRISRKDLNGAEEGARVSVLLYPWLEEYRQPEGSVVEIHEASEAKHGYSQAAIVAEYGLPGEFPAEVLKAANAWPATIDQKEIAKRVDLRKTTIVTIDPEDAKDFDDAVSLEVRKDGLLTLGVHIADVSHYVRSGTALDREAFARGTSVYLVGSVIPMLPERLSNELCSLRPNEDKLTYSVLMTIDPTTGEIQHSEFHKSVIRSAARLTYREAEERILSGRGKHAKLLRSMKKLSNKLYEVRHANGAIDFESEEYQFRFSEAGEPIEAHRKERLGSMRMIEDFMLAANRVVAEHVESHAKHGESAPFLYRIHADPDPAKLRDLALLAKTLGYKLSAENPTPKSIQQFLDSVKGTRDEHLLNQLTLRTMAKAVYSEHNVGHFGLAFRHYTHFTSPIRRYPDLIVHRMLFEHDRPGGMNRATIAEYRAILPEIADATSGMERRATEAERESVKLAQIHLLKSRVGDVFDGTVTGVVNFGMFVQIDGGAEGLVHVRELPGHYLFDEAHYALTRERGYSNRGGASAHNAAERFRMGDAVRVQLIKVLEDRRQLDFRLAGSESDDDTAPTTDTDELRHRDRRNRNRQATSHKRSQLPHKRRSRKR